MAEAAIPVDILNPGQVFACLGFLEAAEALLGAAEGGFDWGPETPAHFHLRAEGEQNPFAAVLAFLAHAEVAELPAGPCFPARLPEKRALPVRLFCREPAQGQNGTQRRCDVAAEPRSVLLSHWADGSGRATFKTYAGNRSAAKICGEMAREIRKLHQPDPASLARDPFGPTPPLGGAFGWDARRAWNGINAGYSPDQAGHTVLASPVTEILAAWGLEHARPLAAGKRKVRYGVWRQSLPPVLARAALGGAPGALAAGRLRFQLEESGKNKVAKFAQWEESE